MEKIESLIEKVLAYNPKANIDIIKKAYIFSREAHCSQKRVEGSPYIQHPISVADILADMKLDSATIAAGFLHDTIEDTGMSAEDIKEMFGVEIAFLVDAVTKLEQGRVYDARGSAGREFQEDAAGYGQGREGHTHQVRRQAA